MKDMICLSAFPKSGITYLSFLVFHSLFGDDFDVKNIEKKFIIDIHVNPNPVFIHPSAPRIIKSHFPYVSGLPFIDRTAKSVYLIRHPIDVMMSAWDFNNLIPGTLVGQPGNEKSAAESAQDPVFRAYVRRWVESGGAGYAVSGTWIQNVRSWLGQNEIPVHVVTYDDLVDKPDIELAAILNFLGIDVSEKKKQKAIERSSMRAMAALELQEINSGKDGIFFRKGLTASYSRGHRFINKGYRNAYDSMLTADDRAIADATFGLELKKYFAGTG